jgi:hypothetical protein
LHFYGVIGVLLDWFKSYLFNRKKRVKLKLNRAENNFSNWKTVKHGVPQGSVLGPLLFNIYIHDFPGLLDKNPNVIMSADDTTIQMSNDKHEELNSNLNSFFIQILKWFQANQLVLNVEKTNLVKFTSSSSSIYSLNISYASYNTMEATTIKFLGLHLHNQLTRKAHINFLFNKLSTVRYMSRLVHILNLEMLKVIYFAHFHSLINLLG